MLFYRKLLKIKEKDVVFFDDFVGVPFVWTFFFKLEGLKN